MRTDLAALALVVLHGVSHGAENPRPIGKNCALAAPPQTAGEESNHGAVLRIFPRAKDINDEYTGCQALFAEYNGKWVVVSLTEVIKGDPIRIWSEHDPDSAAMSCRYTKGKVVRGNPDTCPSAEFILMKSLAPGCVQIIREAVSKHGLGAPRPAACEYE
jgi:hypothetical protein